MEDFREEILSVMDEAESVADDLETEVSMDMSDTAAPEQEPMPEAHQKPAETQEPLGVDAYLGGNDWTQGEMPEPPKPESFGMAGMPEWSGEQRADGEAMPEWQRPADNGGSPMQVPERQAMQGGSSQQPQFQVVVPEGLTDELASLMATQLSETRTQIMGEVMDKLQQSMQMLDRGSL